VEEEISDGMVDGMVDGTVDGAVDGEGEGAGVAVRPLGQSQVQIFGNSSVTFRQAAASSKGPEVMPTLNSVASLESRKNEMRSPQV